MGTYPRLPDSDCVVGPVLLVEAPEILAVAEQRRDLEVQLLQRPPRLPRRSTTRSSPRRQQSEARQTTRTAASHILVESPDVHTTPSWHAMEATRRLWADQVRPSCNGDSVSVRTDVRARAAPHLERGERKLGDLAGGEAEPDVRVVHLADAADAHVLRGNLVRQQALVGLPQVRNDREKNKHVKDVRRRSRSVWRRWCRRR